MPWLVAGAAGWPRGSRPAIMQFVRTTKSGAAAAARIAARKRGELLGLLRPCFARTEPWLQAGKYLCALASGLSRRNGWTIAEHAGDRSPGKTQRLLSRAVWDTAAVRRLAGGGAGFRAGRAGDRGVANGINTVHLACVREHAGHALIGVRQWIPRAQIEDPARSAAMGLPPGLEFRTKGQLATGIAAEALADGICFDFLCGDEVYGSCTELRDFLEARSQAYVLRVARNFRLTLAGGQRLTCADAAARLAASHCEVRSAGTGARGQRWYAWSWLATASAQHHLLTRRHLKTGELAFHYCFVPEGQPVTSTRLTRAAGLRWPVEEQFRAGKDFLGLDESQVRLYHAIARHTVLVMAALAICAVTAAQLRQRTDTQAPPSVRPGQQPPAGTGMIPLTTAEITRLLTRPAPPGAAVHWLNFRRRHQARTRWYHQRTRLTTANEI
jgi:DDE superfamily endonuclease